MTRSSRLLAVGIAILALALVVLLLSTRGTTDPIVVDQGAAATDDAATDTDTAPLADDAARLPVPLTVPDGHEAVAVTVAYDAAVAGLPAPGDRVNVYGVFSSDVPNDLADAALEAASDESATAATTQGGAARVLVSVEVLGVTGAEPNAAGGTVTFVLALEPGDALKAIHLAGGEQLWFTLVPPDHEGTAGDGITTSTLFD